MFPRRALTNIDFVRLGRVGDCQNPFRWQLWLVSVLVATSAWCGCQRNLGPPTAHLKGQVTLNGSSLPEHCEASLTFQTTRAGQGRSCNIPIINGAYDAPAVPKGPVLIHVDIQVPTGKMKSDEGGTPFAEYRSIVPEAYVGGLAQEIGADDFEHNIDLR